MIAYDLNTTFVQTQWEQGKKKKSRTHCLAVPSCQIEMQLTFKTLNYCPCPLSICPAVFKVSSNCDHPIRNQQESFIMQTLFKKKNKIKKNARALQLLMAKGIVIVNDHTDFHSWRKLPLCKHFDLVSASAPLQNTQRLQHLLPFSNIKETEKISKAINQSSRAVARRVG